MKFYNEVLWKFIDITKRNPTDIKLLISPKFKLPLITEDDNGLVLCLPKPIKKKNCFVLNGLVFQNNELGRTLLMKTLLSSLEHLSVHTIVSDFSIYDSWLDGKDPAIASFVIDRVEDLSVKIYMQTRLKELLQNMAIANAISYFTINIPEKISSTQFFLQSALLSYLIAGNNRFVLPSNLKKDLLSMLVLLNNFEKNILQKAEDPANDWWFEDETNDTKIKLADTMYNSLAKYGSSKEIVYLPYADSRYVKPVNMEHVLQLEPIVDALRYTFKMLGLQSPSDNSQLITNGSISKDAVNLLHDFIMEEARKNRVIENYAELCKNTEFDAVTFPEQDIAEYARTYAQYKRPISKLTEQVQFIVADYESDPNKEVGQIDMQAVIQAESSKSGNTNVFVRDERPKRNEAWGILLDISNSLKPFSITPRDMALCLAEVAKELIDWESWGLYAFNNKFLIIKELKEVYGQDVRARIGGLKQGGTSFIPDALEIASRIIIRARSEYNYLFVISDGLPSGYPDIEDKLEKTVKRVMRRGVNIISVGIGNEGLRNYTLGPFFKVVSVYDLLSKFAGMYYSLLMS